MESLSEELLKWPEASKEIEEETRKMVEKRHRFWLSFFIIFIAIAAGLLFLKAGGFGICIGVFCFLGAYAAASSYYEDELYLKKGITKEKIRVKTVLLNEVIKRRSHFGRNASIEKYLKISYHMGDERIVRETQKFHYDIDLLGYGLVGFYGKKITVAYYNKEFYILNHVYLEYDEEEKSKEEIELLKDSKTAVRNLVESIDEKQITRKKLIGEFMHQFHFKMWKMLTILSLFADYILAAIFSTAIHSSTYIRAQFVMAGGFTITFFILCMTEWLSCKKYSGRIWSKKKLRKVREKLGSEIPF